MPIRSLGGILDNPHHYGAAVLAKLAVNMASVIFCWIVLIKPDALSQWPGRIYFPAGGDTAENMVAVVMLGCAVIAIGRLIRKSPPMLFGAIYYALVTLGWLYVFTTLCITIMTGDAPLRPGQFAGVATVTVLALFAFISNPKPSGERESGSDPLF